MNIAITANTSWNIHNFRLGLIQHLQQLGHKVFFVSPYDEFAILVTQKTRAKHIELLHLNRRGKNPLQDFKVHNELKNIYLKHKIDLALHYTIKPNIYGAIACSKIPTKCICNVTGLGYVFLNNSISNKIIRKLFKFALNKSDAIVLQNQDDRDMLLQKKLLQAPKVHMIYGSGVNTQDFIPTLQKKTDKFVFLFIGRLLYDKGIRELFKAIKTLNGKYDSLELHIVGEIDDDNPSAVNHHELEDFIAEHSNVIYFGKRNDVRNNIAQADVVVLPSYREGLPKSLLEAMAMAKPIITTNAPGCSQLVVNQSNGFLCEAQSSADLMNTMEKMFLLPEAERQQMGECSRNLVLEYYDEKVIVGNYQALISKLFP